MGTGFDSHFFKAVIQMAGKHLETQYQKSLGAYVSELQ